MGKLIRMPPGGVMRREAIKRLAAKLGLTHAAASKMRTCEIVAWLRRHTPLGRTGT
jgi:hypothetical protein